MAAVTVKAVGVKTYGTGDVTYTVPVTYSANDIGVLFIETGASATISVNETWAEITGSPKTATNTILHVWWKRLTGAEVSPVATQGGTIDHQCGVMILLAGCVTAGNPWSVIGSAVETTVDTSVAVTGATTDVDNCLVLAAATSSYDSDTGQGTGAPVNADLAGIKYEANYNTKMGNGGGVIVCSGTKVVAGAYTTTTFTLSQASDKGLMSIAFKPLLSTATYSLVCLPGAYALAGQAVTLLYTRIVTLAAGAYVLTGTDIELKLGYSMTGSGGGVGGGSSPNSGTGGLVWIPLTPSTTVWTTVT